MFTVMLTTLYTQVLSTGHPQFRYSSPLFSSVFGSCARRKTLTTLHTQFLRNSAISRSDVHFFLSSLRLSLLRSSTYFSAILSSGVSTLHVHIILTPYTCCTLYVPYMVPVLFVYVYLCAAYPSCRLITIGTHHVLHAVSHSSLRLFLRFFLLSLLFRTLFPTQRCEMQVAGAGRCLRLRAPWRLRRGRKRVSEGAGAVSGWAITASNVVDMV